MGFSPHSKWLNRTVWIHTLLYLGHQLPYLLKGDGTIVDPEIVDDAVTVFIAAVAATQEDGASGIDPL